MNSEGEEKIKTSIFESFFLLAKQENCKRQ